MMLQMRCSITPYQNNTPACSKTWRTKCQVEVWRVSSLLHTTLLVEVEVEFIINSWCVNPYFSGILLLQLGMVLHWLNCSDAKWLS